MAENRQVIVGWLAVVDPATGSWVLVDAAHPIPVDTSPGAKSISAILTQPAIAAATTTTLAVCAAVDLRGGPATLALTIRARYDVAATRGIRIHVVSSPDNIAAGNHPGAINLTVMTDPTAHFIAGELVGLTIQNVTDGSSGVITVNTELTVTVAALGGGLTNRWNPGDTYLITGANYDAEDWDAWIPFFATDGILRQTKNYDTSPAYVKVLIENLDPAQAITDLAVIASVGV